MSNLLKRGSAISKEERIIDYNELIKTKLQNIMDANDKQKADPDGFVNGLTAEVVEELISDSEEGGALETEVVGHVDVVGTQGILDLVELEDRCPVVTSVELIAGLGVEAQEVVAPPCGLEACGLHGGVGLAARDEIFESK